MTIKDIARESGYAVGTVSRVLNNNPRVSEDARRKILAVVAQHGYQPNANAKHLKQQVPEGLALIVKGTQNALFADLLDKLQPCLEARGYTPTVYYNNGSTDELACAQTIFAERRPCGLFFIGAHPQCFTPALRRHLPPKGEGRALFMRIRRKLVVAVFLFRVQTQQLEARENQQCRNDNIRYAGDDVVGVVVAHKIAQQRIEPV